MILQEKIKKEADGYGKLAPAFIEGAEFAIENQWISVEEDLPCNHEELLTSDSETVLVIVKESEDAPIDTDYMIKLNGDTWEWVHYYGGATYWMPIPKLPKE